MTNQPKLLSEPELSNELDGIVQSCEFQREGSSGVCHWCGEREHADIHTVKNEVLSLIKQQQQAYADWVIGEDTDIEEIKIGRFKNIKSERNGADVAAFDWAINIGEWQNNLRAEQRARNNKEDV